MGIRKMYSPLSPNTEAAKAFYNLPDLTEFFFRKLFEKRNLLPPDRPTKYLHDSSSSSSSSSQTSPRTEKKREKGCFHSSLFPKLFFLGERERIFRGGGGKGRGREGKGDESPQLENWLPDCKVVLLALAPANAKKERRELGAICQNFISGASVMKRKVVRKYLSGKKPFPEKKVKRSASGLVILTYYLSPNIL